MKAFETPFVEVKKFDVEDILTDSSVEPTTSSEEQVVIIECIT